MLTREDQLWHSVCKHVPCTNNYCLDMISCSNNTTKQNKPQVTCVNNGCLQPLRSNLIRGDRISLAHCQYLIIRNVCIPHSPRSLSTGTCLADTRRFTLVIPNAWLMEHAPSLSPTSQQRDTEWAKAPFSHSQLWERVRGYKISTALLQSVQPPNHSGHYKLVKFNDRGDYIIATITQLLFTCKANYLTVRTLYSQLSNNKKIVHLK